MTITIIGFLLLLFSHAAAGIYSSPLKYSKRTVYIIWGIWAAFQTGLLFYTEYVLTNLAAQFFTGFVLALVGQYVIYFATTKGKLAQRLFSILTYSIFFCISMTLFIQVKGSIGEAYPILTVFIQAALLLGADLYFILYVCPLCRAAEKNITRGWISLVVVNIVFIITLILSSVFPERISGFSDPSFITFIFLSISIMAVYPVIFRSISSMSEAAMKREVEAQNKLLIAQIEAENAQLVADRQSRHDRRHHNLVMLEFAKNNDIESIKEYLSNLMKSDINVYGGARYCENTTVNTVLAVYERRAAEAGISVDISAQISSSIDVLPQDLVIVIANLFENAIHATAGLKIERRSIDITIKESVQRLFVKIENCCDEKLVFDATRHGIGINSVIATAGKYDGMYDFSAEDGIFSAKVVFNLK